MKAVVDEALCDVLVRDPSLGLDLADVDDALVRNETHRARVEHRVVLAKALGEVVGAEHRHLGRLQKTLRTEHRDVHPRDRKDAGRSPWRRRHRTGPIIWTPKIRNKTVTGQIRRKVCLHTDGPDSRPTTTVWYRKRLMQVEMAHIRPERPGLGKADHRVEVRSVQVHLSAIVMDDVTDVDDRRFENAMGGRVGDHHRCKVVGMLGRLRLEVCNIDVSVIVALDHDNLHPSHHCRRGVRAMCRRRDQADIAVSFASGLVVSTDGEQPGEFTLCTRVRLHRNRVVTRDRRKPGFEVVDQFEIPRRLIEWDIRMDVGELRPGDGCHLR